MTGFVVVLDRNTHSGAFAFKIEFMMLSKFLTDVR